jgi:hypothetical protein
MATSGEDVRFDLFGVLIFISNLSTSSSSFTFKGELQIQKQKGKMTTCLECKKAMPCIVT